jgi:hypothetical protein
MGWVWRRITVVFSQVRRKFHLAFFVLGRSRCATWVAFWVAVYLQRGFHSSCRSNGLSTKWATDFLQPKIHRFFLATDGAGMATDEEGIAVFDMPPTTGTPFFGR